MIVDPVYVLFALSATSKTITTGIGFSLPSGAGMRNNPLHTPAYG